MVGNEPNDPVSTDLTTGVRGVVELDHVTNAEPGTRHVVTPRRLPLMNCPLPPIKTVLVGRLIDGNQCRRCC
jgi:hypothetical protein